MATLPLLPLPESKLIGIARLAAEGESLRQGHEVEYFTLPVRSLLNRCTGVRMPFEWTINPYRGCEFGCKYCFARYTHEYMEIDGAEFEKKIFVKKGAEVFLPQEISRKYSYESSASGVRQPERRARRGSAREGRAPAHLGQLPAQAPEKRCQAPEELQAACGFQQHRIGEFERHARRADAERGIW